MKTHVSLLSLCLIFLLSSSNPLLAQVENDKTKELADSISNLYTRYFSLQESKDDTEDKLKNLEEKIKIIENQATGNTEQLISMSDADRRTRKTIYERSRLSIEATANYLDAVNDGLNALEFSVSSLDYSNSIFELNNPTNTDLGFSLDKAILRIVDDKIINGKFGRKFGSKLRSIVSGIINNPIINNPITKAVVSTVPAVSSIASVFNVVNSVAVGEDDINTQALNAFNRELQKYVAHYEALAKASRDLDFNLANLKVKTEAVRQLTTNFARQSVLDLYTNQDTPPSLEEMSMNDVVNRYYNYATVNQYIQKLENQANRDYNFLSTRVVFPVVGRSKAAFIIEEVEKLYNEYVTTISTYHKNIVIILNNATTLSDDPSKVSQKIEELNGDYTRLLESYEQNVDLENIKAREDNIPRY